MTDDTKINKKPTDVTITRAKGRPMLSWVGKKPLGRVSAFPAQHVERYSAADAANNSPLGQADWSKWPKDLPHGGLLYHGDNKEVRSARLSIDFSASPK